MTKYEKIKSTIALYENILKTETDEHNRRLYTKWLENLKQELNEMNKNKRWKTWKKN